MFLSVFSFMIRGMGASYVVLSKKGILMTYPALIGSVLLVACAASASADDGVRMVNGLSTQQPVMVAMGGNYGPLNFNAGGPPGRADLNTGPNANHGDRAAVAHTHNEGFGYGFERRRQQQRQPARQQGQQNK